MWKKARALIKVAKVCNVNTAVGVRLGVVGSLEFLWY